MDFADQYEVPYFDASHFTPRTTNGAAADTEELATNDVMNTQYLFDHTTEEAVQLKLRMPDDWNGDPIKAKVYFDGSAGASTTDVVVWGISGRAAGDGDAMDGAWGTEVTVSKLVGTLGTVKETDATDFITIAGSPQCGDLVWIQVARKAGAAADTMDAEDAKFLGIAIQYRKRRPIKAW
jgi:hypothetical protein